MRKTAISILLTLAVVSGHAQSAYDGLLFSENNYEGTARSVAMGNAFTALGGDLGSITINPAGSAVAGYSQFTITPGLTFSASTAQGVSPFTDGGLPYFERKMKSSMTSFNMPNMGITINWDTNRNSGLKNLTFGFVVNKIADFSQDVYANGMNSTTSFMGAMAFNATEDYMWADELSLSQNQYAYDDCPWEYVVGYNSNMIAPFGGDDQGDFFAGASELVFDDGEIAIGGELDQKYGRRVSGGKYDYVFNLGANVSDFLYLGANLGFSSLNYDYEDYFKEEAVDPADFEIVLDGEDVSFRQMKYGYWYNAEGSGAYAKFGAILTPGYGLRIGAAIQTPAVTNITERWQYSGSTEFSASKFNGYEASPEGTYSYTFTEPFRANLGLAYTIGSIAVLSADYEYCDYSQMKFRTRGGGIDYFDDVNAAIKDIFGPQNAWRFGAEAKLGALALRGGYGFSSSPEKHFEGPYRSSFSFGLGYSSNGSFFADFAVRKNTYNNEYYMPYSDYIFDEDGTPADPAPELLITRSVWKVLLTLGWRF